MASIMDLLKSNKKDIYGNNGLIYIESRGVVNPARVVALAASSPTAIADMIGNAVAGVAGGSAKRPSDTIYKGTEFFNKPISLAAPTEALLKDSIKKDQPYFVKTEPNPGLNLYRDIKNAVKSPGGIQSAAITALNKYGSKDGIKKLKDFRNQLKNPSESDTYGSQWSYAGNDKMKPKSEDVKYSTHYKDYDDNGKLKKRQQAVVSYRNGTTAGEKYPVVNSPWDKINSEVMSYIFNSKDKDKDITDFQAKPESLNIPYVLLKHYKKTDKNILLPGTVTGISEDYAPEVNAFRFVGSPFNLYRYGGVERSLKFDLKLYWENAGTRYTMLDNLNRLRKLVYPDENITAITYPNTTDYSPLSFNPNLVYLTINGLYDNLLGIVDSLSISIDENISWGTVNFYGDGRSEERATPTVYNVSIGFKIIENLQITKKPENQYTYEYNNYFTNYDSSLKKNGEPGFTQNV